jgi:hypothetical protein
LASVRIASSLRADLIFGKDMSKLGVYSDSNICLVLVREIASGSEP